MTAVFVDTVRLLSCRRAARQFTAQKTDARATWEWALVAGLSALPFAAIETAKLLWATKVAS